MAIRRTSELRPLSSEHHHALLLAFQLKKGLAGHGDSAGAPKDLPGLINLAKRFEESTFVAHTRAEEELLAPHLAQADAKRLTSEHKELLRLLGIARQGRPSDARFALTTFADLMERHVRWEERELFPSCEKALGHDALSDIGHQLERRLVLSRRDTTAPRRS